MIVEKIPIVKLLLIFGAYLVSHFLIGKKLENIKLENKAKPGNPETEKELKTFTFMFKWWPAACVVVVILYLIYG